MRGKPSAEQSGKAAKSGRRRWIPVILLVPVLLIVILMLCVFSNLDGIVKSGIEKYGSRAVGTAVTVKSVRIGLKEGRAAVRGLTVANPEGFSGKNAFTLGEIGAAIDVHSIVEDVKIIDSITVLEPEILVEMNGDRTFNLNVILDNLSRSAPSSKEKTGAQSTEEADQKRLTKEEPLLIIRNVLFRNGIIRGRLEFGGDRETVLRLPNVQMRNLGAPDGATPTELTRQIIGELSRRALAEVRKKAVSAATDKVKNEAESAVRKKILKGF